MLIPAQLVAAGLLAALLSPLPSVAAGKHAHHDHGPTAAHVHGAATMDVAVDGNDITFELSTPLDNLVGFERAPRTDAERERFASAIGKLRDANAMFSFDASAGCVAGPVTLSSPLLSPDGTVANAPASHADPHADLQASYTFRCAHASRVRHVDVGLFGFAHLRSVAVQGATPGGQFKRQLKRPTRRLPLVR